MSGDSESNAASDSMINVLAKAQLRTSTKHDYQFRSFTVHLQFFESNGAILSSFVRARMSGFLSGRALLQRALKCE
jgi:hypothetical protein